VPIVDIYLRRGRTPEELTTIADSIHDALIEEFGIPKEDRFQVIHQREPYELIYDKTFLGGPRTDEFVMVRVIVGKERPPDVKLRLYAAIAANLSQRVGISVEDVMIMLHTVDLTDLSAAGGRAFDPPHLRGQTDRAN
jgi:phenylpyruvate tautomerase PptA (4-oxalocrotonate tautomerase family)